jgi:hypothetical protein
VHPAVLLFALVLPPAEPEVSLADLQRFPPQDVAQDRYRFGETPGLWAPTQSAEQKKYVKAWRQLVIAHVSHRPEDKRRALRELRRLLGPEAYRKGWMPSFCV